jgi:hypothetical protein
VPVSNQRRTITLKRDHASYCNFLIEEVGGLLRERATILRNID